MMKSPFSFLQPSTGGQAVDQYSLGQKQALINALKQSALQPQQAQSYGPVASRNSPITPIVQALSAYLAKGRQDDLNKDFKGLADKQSADTLAQMGGSQPAPLPQPAIQPQQVDPYSNESQDAMKSGAQIPQQLATALAPASPEQAPQSLRDPKWVTSLNPGGFNPQFAAKQYQALGPKDYSSQYVEPFIKPETYRSAGNGVAMSERSGKLSRNGQPLNQQSVDEIYGHDTSDKPLDELAKLNADFKAGRMTQSDYNARKNLMTTRAANTGIISATDPNLESKAQRIANYDEAAPTGRAAYSPGALALMARVDEIHKERGTEFSAANFPAVQKTLNGFTAGKQGDQIRSFNVGISHLNTAQELADALDNGNVKLFNRVAQRWAEETGSAAPTNFDSAKQIIKAEIVKAVSGSGGGQEDREKALSGLDRAGSPAELKGAVITAQKLMGGQMGGLKRQYEQGTYRKDFERFLSPDAKPFLQTKEGTGDKNFEKDATPAKGWGKAQVVQ